MTYILQVLDLVVNGPLKAHIKSLRAETIFKYFQEYKALYDAELLKPKEERRLPKFKVPKPTLIQCIKDILALFKLPTGEFTSAKFQKSVKQSFIKTVTAPDANGDFVLHSRNEAKGSLPIAPAGTVDASEFVADDNDIDYDDLIALINEDFNDVDSEVI